MLRWCRCCCTVASRAGWPLSHVCLCFHQAMRQGGAGVVAWMRHSCWSCRLATDSCLPVFLSDNAQRWCRWCRCCCTAAGRAGSPLTHVCLCFHQAMRKGGAGVVAWMLHSCWSCRLAIDSCLPVFSSGNAQRWCRCCRMDAAQLLVVQARH